MPSPLIHLDALPSAVEFYARYWNRQPFVVRGAIAPSDMDDLISADELAGLAMEDAPRSRLLKTAGATQDWSCAYGPFDEDDFAAAGQSHWSLLVQNVEQFHPATAELLRHFDFAPRWLLDDIMVGFSAPGGSVGPHFDTYHVFLVQGPGKRRWKISRDAIVDRDYIDGMDFKVLKNGFDGDEIEVTCGDVLYVPPGFGHEGTTVEDALTYSVGLLGPKMSELLTGYGQYLAECEDRDPRYVADGLDTDSAGFTVNRTAVGELQASLGALLNAQSFESWLVEFLTQSSHEDFGVYTEREDLLSADALRTALNQGNGLIKPAYVKFVLTMSSRGEMLLGFDGHSFTLTPESMAVVRSLIKENPVRPEAHPDMLADPATFDLLLTLYNHEALELA
ncbi:cupin domain-containing protein [Magnetovibrio sp.]|uniref:cupin domain-containing protein n=1 Tax=Magnetovibrio sp. TaxID=2024836 RepID=UPI002F93E5B5